MSSDEEKPLRLPFRIRTGAGSNQQSRGIFGVLGHIWHHHQIPLVSRQHRVHNTSPRRVGVELTDDSNYDGYFLEDEDTFLILVSIYAETPELDCAHEVGHLVDRLIGGSRYATYQNLDLLAPWCEAVGDTDLVKQLRDAFDQAVELGDFSTRPDQAELEYLVRPEELFARSFAQYVTGLEITKQHRIEAQEARDLLRKQLSEKQRASSRESGFPGYWSDSDFSPVQEAIDLLMREIGWHRGARSN